MYTHGFAESESQSGPYNGIWSAHTIALSGDALTLSSDSAKPPDLVIVCTGLSQIHRVGDFEFKIWPMRGIDQFGVSTIH